MIKGALILSVGFALGYTKGLRDSGVIKEFIDAMGDIAVDEQRKAAEEADAAHAAAHGGVIKSDAVDAEAEEIEEEEPAGSTA